MMAFKAAPALAAGNCFILKPSEKTPFASLALGKLIKLAGFPAGVFQVLSGDGSTGALLSSHLKIRKISFTGSTAVGKKIQVAAANSNLKRVSLELGGKSPAVVFNDCNLNKAVKDTVTSILNNTGQACIAISRIYVQEGLYSEFTKLYKQQMEKWGKLAGEPTDPATQLGPLVSLIFYDV
jgi:aldehyde dehydrogenase (NAD+)